MGGLLVCEGCVGGKMKINDESELCVVKDVWLLVVNSLEPSSEPEQEPLSVSNDIIIPSLPYMPISSS